VSPTKLVPSGMYATFEDTDIKHPSKAAGTVTEKEKQASTSCEENEGKSDGTGDRVRWWDGIDRSERDRVRWWDGTRWRNLLDTSNKYQVTPLPLDNVTIPRPSTTTTATTTKTADNEPSAKGRGRARSTSKGELSGAGSVVPAATGTPALFSGAGIRPRPSRYQHGTRGCWTGTCDICFPGFDVRARSQPSVGATIDIASQYVSSKPKNAVPAVAARGCGSGDGTGEEEARKKGR